MTDHNALVERVARELCMEGGFDPDERMSNDRPRWKYYRPLATVSIAVVLEEAEQAIYAAKKTAFEDAPEDYFDGMNDAAAALRALKKTNDDTRMNLVSTGDISEGHPRNSSTDAQAVASSKLPSAPKGEATEEGS